MRALLVALVLPALLHAEPVRAIDDPVCQTHVPATDRSSLWAPPLDRQVRLPPSTGSVRELLEQIARLAGLELSYSAELLPADRRCLRLPSAPVGALFDLLLAGTTLRPVVLGKRKWVLHFL